MKHIILSVTFLSAVATASAQTADYSQANYTPSTTGTMVPAETNNTNLREERSFAGTNTDPATRLLAPVELSEFFAASGNGAVDITWRALYEPGLKRYEIEFSKDNQVFQQVGVVNAGTYLNGRAYNFRHTPLNVRDRIFYRLKMTDGSGHYDYTPVISVVVATNTANYIFPTLVNTGVVSVNLNEAFETVQIVDMQGRVLQTLNLNGKLGRTDIPLLQSAKGVCVVRILGQQPVNNQPRKTIVQKIFVQ